MGKTAIIATGESVDEKLAKKIYNYNFDYTIAINKSFLFNERFDFLFSSDAKFFKKYYDKIKEQEDNLNHIYKKICVQNTNIEEIKSKNEVYFCKQGYNSALNACLFASSYLKIKEIYLFGVDLKGDHYFNNDDNFFKAGEKIFARFNREFEIEKYFFDNNNIKIYNCNLDSNLTNLYEKRDILNEN